MTSLAQKKKYPKTAQSRDDRLKAALKLNLAKRKAQSRSKSMVQVENKTSGEAVDASKD